MCEEPGCNRQSSFNYVGERGHRRCSEHRLEGMVNVALPRCAAEGCEQVPSFGYAGRRCALVCGVHRQPGMARLAACVECCWSDPYV